MPRIVAGWAGSLQLVAPSSGSRPTSDRVREAVFSALEARGVLPGARVLDLYAGSGALGLEALSRGAAEAVLVDNAQAAVRALRRNAATVLKAAPEPAPRVRVVARSVHAHLAAAPEEGVDRPTLVFLDPPYALVAAAVGADLDLLVTRAAPGGLLVLERSSRDAPLDPPPGLLVERARTYGDTALTLLEVVGDTAQAEPTA